MIHATGGGSADPESWRCQAPFYRCGITSCSNRGTPTRCASALDECSAPTLCEYRAPRPLSSPSTSRAARAIVDQLPDLRRARRDRARNLQDVLSRAGAAPGYRARPCWAPGIHVHATGRVGNQPYRCAAHAVVLRVCEQLIVRFERAFVESLVASHLGRRLRHGLSFESELDCRSERARRWLDLVLHVVRQVDAGFTPSRRSIATRQIEQALLAMLLKHNRTTVRRRCRSHAAAARRATCAGRSSSSRRTRRSRSASRKSSPQAGRACARSSKAFAGSVALRRWSVLRPCGSDACART